MSELSKDGLLEWFRDTASNGLTPGYTHEQDVQAYQQIKILIQNQPIKEKRYQAKINDKTTIKFYLSDLVDRNDSFTMRQFVLPWLLKGNKPELLKED